MITSYKSFKLSSKAYNEDKRRFKESIPSWPFKDGALFDFDLEVGGEEKDIVEN